MKREKYSEEKLEDINLIIRAFKIKNVNLTKNQAHTAYNNWSEENYASSWTGGLDTWSEERIVDTLKHYIPKYKRKFLKENSFKKNTYSRTSPEFLFSINDEKFFWKMLLPKKGIRFAKTIEECEYRKICLTQEQHLNLLYSLEYRL